MLWISDCPFSWDQGVVGPLVLADGELVLGCDSCGSMWRTMADVAEERRTDGAAAREIGAGDPNARPLTLRWAAASDLRGTPWETLEWKEL
jgi:hypothetical protein